MWIFRHFPIHHVEPRQTTGKRVENYGLYTQESLDTQHIQKAAQSVRYEGRASNFNEELDQFLEHPG